MFVHLTSSDDFDNPYFDVLWFDGVTCSLPQMLPPMWVDQVCELASSLAGNCLYTPLTLQMFGNEMFNAI